MLYCNKCSSLCVWLENLTICCFNVKVMSHHRLFHTHFCVGNVLVPSGDYLQLPSFDIFNFVYVFWVQFKPDLFRQLPVELGRIRTHLDNRLYLHK